MTAAIVADRLTPVRWAWLPMTVGAGVLVVAGAGAVAPVVPVAALLALALVLTVRLRTAVLVLLAVALVADNPGERPMEGRWQSPLFGIGQLLYENLHLHTGIAALRFSLLELAIGGLLLVSLSRAWRGDPIDDAGPAGTATMSLRNAAALSAVTILALALWGVVRGGDFKQALWQMRQLFWMPVIVVLTARALRTAQDRVALLRLVVAAAWVRCVVGIYFTFVIARPAGWSLEYTMTHSDAILTVVAMLAAMATLIEQARPSHWVMNALVQPVLALGLHVNDRRIALVGLALGGVALIALSPAPLRRLARQMVILSVPLGLLYLAVGWHSQSPVFAPVATVRAIVTSEDTSSQTRDIENYNLIQTLKARPLAGSGFGHEYIEVVQAYRVDHLFAQYRYIAHNSVLWLLSLSGWLGFTALWTLFVAAASVALWAHRRASAPLDRVTAFAAVAATISLLLQAWGDMGLQSWMGSLVWGSLVGTTGVLASSIEQNVRAS